MNRWTGSGRVERSEEKYTQNNKRKVEFRVKCVEVYQGKEYPTWVNCELWSDDQQILEGSYVCVDGKIKVASWEDNEGKKQYRTFVKATSVEAVGGGNVQAPAPQNEEDDLPFS